MKLNKVHHIAIIASDYERSKEFYTSILGAEILNEYYREERDSYKLDLAINGEYLLELFSFPNPPERLTYPEARGLRHIAFEVDDVVAVQKELKDKGVKTTDLRKDPYTGKQTIFFFDPDELPIEVYEA
ncbi:MAG TPA: VOC family protein [Nevskiaceae bacterium]|nr:VOC family protein [Nevskiaceae bacterium]